MTYLENISVSFTVEFMGLIVTSLIQLQTPDMKPDIPREIFSLCVEQS